MSSLTAPLRRPRFAWRSLHLAQDQLSSISMAHILQTRRTGAVVDLKVTFDGDKYSFNAEVHKWDDNHQASQRLGAPLHFTLPKALYHNFTTHHLRDRLGNVFPPCLPGGSVLFASSPRPSVHLIPLTSYIMSLWALVERVRVALGSFLL